MRTLGKSIKARLEYLRKQIQDEDISYSELAELQSLAEFIDSSDALLLEWAGIPEQSSYPRSNNKGPFAPF